MIIGTNLAMDGIKGYVRDFVKVVINLADR